MSETEEPQHPALPARPGWLRTGRFADGVDMHVRPVRDLVDHDPRRTCWCAPRVEFCCPDCTTIGAECWRCGGEGWVTESPEAGALALVMHNAVDGRE